MYYADAALQAVLARKGGYYYTWRHAIMDLMTGGIQEEIEPLF